MAGATTPDAAKKLGTTSWTVENLKNFCQVYQKQKPTFHVTTCNCQDFVESFCAKLGCANELPWKIMDHVDTGVKAGGVIGGAVLAIRTAAATATAGELLVAGSVGAACGVGAAFVFGTGLCLIAPALLQGSHVTSSGASSAASSASRPVYYVGSTKTFSSGDKVIYGLEGVYIGPSQKDASKAVVQFTGHQNSSTLPLSHLSFTAPPALPGGLKAEHSVYYISSKQMFSSGDKLIYGLEGEVIGPSTQKDDNKVSVRFAGHKCPKNILPSNLSSAVPPALPGGWKVEDSVYYIGSKETFLSGDELIYGLKGEVMGPSNEGQIQVQFEGHKQSTDILLRNLSSAAPSLRLRTLRHG